MTLDTYDSPEAEALLRAGEERLAPRPQPRRERVASAIGAASFLVSATLLALLAPWTRAFSVANLVLVLGVWVAVERVKFPVASGWTYPTMLAFVPMLFLLPTPLTPLVAMVAVLLRAGPAIVRGRARLGMVPTFVTDAWFTIGPAVVIVAAGAQRFTWSHWPIYVGALAAQIVFDATATIGWSWLVEGIKPRVQLPLLSWVYVVDVTLAPLGLVVAAAAVARPGLVLVSLAPTMLLVFLARERQQRLEHTLALSTAYRGTTLLLGDIVEADDHYTGVHSRDVVDLSIAVAEALDLDATRRRDVEFAALLHDVGKIRIPKEIINKPGKLTEEEWVTMRRHTIIGEQMLAQIGGTLAGVGRIVRSSHERFDGSGYPDGLAGEAIPVEARIVCACDAYSAMTTDRAYRPALSRTGALVELRRCAGTQFDPKVVEVLERLLAAPEPDEPEPDRPGWINALTGITVALMRRRVAMAIDEGSATS